MKKILTIEKCIDCPYSHSVLLDRDIKIICFNRNKLHYLNNDTRISIPDDCPLANVKEGEEQSPWINVKDELPKLGKEVLTKSPGGYKVLYLQSDGNWTNDEYDYDDIEYWMLIPE